MVQINYIEETFLVLFHEDNCVGMIPNLLTFLDVRLQIRQQKLEGYSISIGLDETKYSIDLHGKVYCNSKKLPTWLYTDYVSKLF